MVLPGRIELTTSPLPRGCSTTELRQQGGWLEEAPPTRNWRDPCHKVPGGARKSQTDEFLSHDRTFRQDPENGPATAPFGGFAGKSQAPQGAGQRASRSFG